MIESLLITAAIMGYNYLIWAIARWELRLEIKETKKRTES